MVLTPAGGRRRAPWGARVPWYVPSALRGTGSNARNARLRAAALGVAAVALAGVPAGCGSSSSPSGTALGADGAGTYHLRVVKAELPTRQRLGQTSLLRIGVRNTGKRTVPALVITTTIAGKQGESSGIPFAVRDRQPGLSQPERPVWVLAESYPKLAGSSQSAGAANADRTTFDFGPLKPGATREAVWKLSAVRAGRYTLLYRVGADLAGAAKAVGPGGVTPGGSFDVTISREPPDTIVTDSGEVVEIHGSARRAR